MSKMNSGDSTPASNFPNRKPIEDNNGDARFENRYSVALPFGERFYFFFARKLFGGEEDLPGRKGKRFLLNV